MKKCNKCGCEKELSEFGYNKNTKDKLSYYCKECMRKIDKLSKQRINKQMSLLEKPNENTTFKVCSCCGENKLLKEYNNDQTTKDGKARKCKCCNREIEKIRNNSKPEERKVTEQNKLNELRRIRVEKRKIKIKHLDETTDRLVTIYKSCIKCKETKQLIDFRTNWNNVDGRSSMCRQCLSEKERIKYNNDEKFKQRENERCNNYKRNNKDKISEHNKQEHVKQKKDETRRQNRKRRNEKDKQFHVVNKLRSSLSSNFKRFSKKGKTFTSKKYGIDYLKIFEHIGPRPGPEYEIDHIVPCSIFPDLNEPGIAALLYHHTNFQWLTKEKNIIKWNHIIPDMIREHKLEWICEKIGINLSEHEQNNYLLNIIKEED